MRANLEDVKSYGMRMGPKLVFTNESAVQVTGQSIPAASPPMIFLNPAGAIAMRLPPSDPAAVGAATKGQVFIFVNQSGSIVTLQDSGGVGFTTAVTVAANAATRVVCTGSATSALGWIIW